MLSPLVHHHTIDRSLKEYSNESENALVAILCHLLELFWTHVHNQQWPILNPRSLYQSIRARQCPSFLCLAICAVSYRFSSHPLVRNFSGSTATLDEILVLTARRDLYQQLEQQDLARIQTLCVLILWDTASGRGTQAWADSGNKLLSDFGKHDLTSLDPYSLRTRRYRCSTKPPRSSYQHHP